MTTISVGLDEFAINLLLRHKNLISGEEEDLSYL